MTKNQKLIKEAIELLKKVDKRTIKYKNTFSYTLCELISLYGDYNKKKIKSFKNTRNGK